MLLICNVAWMKQYAGITNTDYPVNGGEFVANNGYGHEAINFKKNGQFMYGYMQASNGTININRIGASADDEYIDNILVVWRAKSKNGSVIIGWYRNARVYRKEQVANKRRTFDYEGKTINPGYLIRAETKNTFLLPVQYRHLSFPVLHKGFGSRTFVSFLDSGRTEVVQYREDLLRYIKQAENDDFSTAKRGKRGKISTETKLLIEKTAIDATAEFYINQGYDVKSVETENVGYDLLASKGEKTLYVEVKGTSVETQERVNVTLTPNEYKKSKQAKLKYRIVIVINALKNPELFEYYWDSESEAWFSEQSLEWLNISESVAANLSM